MTDAGRAAVQTIGGKPVLRFERWLAHPQAKVWRAITEPAEAAHWFPAMIETELQVGARMRFTFPDAAPVDETTSDGEILELDAPKVYAFRWKADVLRFELVPEGAGTRLVFTQTISEGWEEWLTAGRTAVGWDVCLDALAAQLDDRSFEPPQQWLGAMEHYIEKFGLAEGEVLDTAAGFLVRFRRDLVWKTLDEVWSLLVEDTDVTVGAEPPLPATNGYFEAGVVTAVEAPRLVEYEWVLDGRPAGRVRWEFTHDPELGTRVELTQTLPRRLADRRAEALAVWQIQLESFFAAIHGEIRCPWPEERTEQLREAYAARLS